jgi:CO/xanthine dehydrogenase FAD-binding subunit
MRRTPAAPWKRSSVCWGWDSEAVVHCEHYLTVTSLEEAIGLLRVHAGRSRVVAGGTDLVLELGRGKQDAEVLVDLTGIASLRYVREVDGVLHVGALSTHQDLASSPLLRAKAVALALAAAAVGSPQIRQVGTVGGNLVNARPAADTAIALLALGARVRVFGDCGEREMDMIDLYAGVGRCTLDAGAEILTEVFFPVPSGSGFQRLARRKALALPIINAAAAVTLDADGTCRDAGVAVGPMAPVPWRSREAEAALRGRTVDAAAIEDATAAAVAEVTCRDSIRACAGYRRPMVGVLVRRALVQAMGGALDD